MPHLTRVLPASMARMKRSESLMNAKMGARHPFQNARLAPISKVVPGTNCSFAAQGDFGGGERLHAAVGGGDEQRAVGSHVDDLRVEGRIARRDDTYRPALVRMERAPGVARAGEARALEFLERLAEPH